jgi:hypothetical protein
MLLLKFSLSLFLFFTLEIGASHFENGEESKPQFLDEPSWLSKFLIGFFSPEGLKALERIERYARLSEPNLHEIEIESDEFDDKMKFYSKLNSIDVITGSDSDSDDSEDTFDDYEDYGLNLSKVDILKVNIYNRFNYFSKYFNYQEILFKAAISQSNFVRLNHLLTMKLDKKFTNEQRLQILSDAINIGLNDESGMENHLQLSIISLLLKHNFFISSHDHFLLECALKGAFKNEKVAQTFLTHNFQFFSNLKTFNYVAHEIYQRDFYAARVALESGVDPDISYLGRNALDVALSITNYEPNSDHLLLTNIIPFSRKKEDPLSYLIRILREMGLSESMTFGNYFHACNENRIDLAHQILQSGSIEPQEFYLPKNKFTSPLSKALHSEDIDLIKSAADIFLTHLTSSQLHHSRLECLNLLNNINFIDNSAILSDLLEHIDNLISN